MGKSYWFECPKCGYQAKVSGRADRGINLSVQTVVCRDCKELYDAVTRVRIAAESPACFQFHPRSLWNSAKQPPTFQAAVNRLTVTGLRHFQWIQFPLRCPVRSFHRIQPWNAPDKCPRCGTYLEQNTLPYRIWD